MASCSRASRRRCRSAGEGSLFQRVFSAPGGIDPYAAAVSDVYQDLFGEGSYTGKGIYDVDAFEAALAGRVPENALLSHDLFEGIFARAGLASDIEVVEEFPSRYDVAARRQHRWTRGDWQLLPWIARARRAEPDAVPPAIGRWKMVDNLRRTLLGAAASSALLAWLDAADARLPSRGPRSSSRPSRSPPSCPSLFAMVPRRRRHPLRSHLRALAADLRLALSAELALARLPGRPGLADGRCDRAGRSFVLFVNPPTSAGVDHRRAGQRQPRGSTCPASTGGWRAARPSASSLAASWSTLRHAVVAAGRRCRSPCCGSLRRRSRCWASRPPRPSAALSAVRRRRHELRLIARRTWRFFETFVTPADNMLPPDNFQEDPKPVVAHRTSPTNIGLYLLSAIAARDFGWTGTPETVERLEAAFATMQQIARASGPLLQLVRHDAICARSSRLTCPRSTAAISPATSSRSPTRARNGLRVPPPLDAERGPDRDAAPRARSRAARCRAAGGERGLHAGDALEEFDALAGPGRRRCEALAPALAASGGKGRRCRRATSLPRERATTCASRAVLFWIEALQRSGREPSPRPSAAADAPQPLQRTPACARRDARATMASAMEFGFLLDPERKLLSIGYRVADDALDPSCYDLLASEARLASFVRDRQGRRARPRTGSASAARATPVGRGSALISWSGSMFEYLMPSLVMRAPAGSLLEQTNRLVVRTPAGLRTIARRAVGHLGVGLQRPRPGAHLPVLEFRRARARPRSAVSRENLVIAPYATGLAAMVDPAGALRNFTRARGDGRQRPLRLLRGARLHAGRDCPTERTWRSCAASWRTTRA